MQQESLVHLQQRGQSTEVVEKQMSEISSMIQRLAHIVHEQQSMIERIDQSTITLSETVANHLFVSLI